jgi:hypothetical protein
VAITAADGSGPAVGAAVAAPGSKHCCNCSSNSVQGGKWRKDPDSGVGGRGAVAAWVLVKSLEVNYVRHASSPRPANRSCALLLG